MKHYLFEDGEPPKLVGEFEGNPLEPIVNLWKTTKEDIAMYSSLEPHVCPLFTEICQAIQESVRRMEGGE